MARNRKKHVGSCGLLMLISVTPYAASSIFEDSRKSDEPEPVKLIRVGQPLRAAGELEFRVFRDTRLAVCWHLGHRWGRRDAYGAIFPGDLSDCFGLPDVRPDVLDRWVSILKRGRFPYTGLPVHSHFRYTVLDGRLYQSYRTTEYETLAMEAIIHRISEMERWKRREAVLDEALKAHLERGSGRSSASPAAKHVVVTLIFGLETVGSAKALPTLRRAERDCDFTVSEAARDAIGAIVKRRGQRGGDASGGRRCPSREVHPAP